MSNEQALKLPMPASRAHMADQEKTTTGTRAAFQLTSPRPAGVDREELERFKRDIDLRSFALSKGYRVHEKDCTPKWTVLRNGPNDEIVVGRGKDQHWCYFSHSDATDRGSIVDFVRRRELKDKPWGEVFRELREFAGTRREAPDPPVASPAPVQDRSAVLRMLAEAAEVSTHPYLEARGLSPDILGAARFRGTWKQGPGRHRSVLFIHNDGSGPCGAEVKNLTFTGFTPGGSKGLWVSRVQPNDCRLVITESGIDALSYHEVNRHPRTRYVSVAGHLTRKQLGTGADGRDGLLGAAISWMAAGSTIVAATDNDKAGHEFAARIAELVAKYPHVTYERHAPSLGKDWNDHLQALRCQTRSVVRETKRERGLQR